MQDIRIEIRKSRRKSIGIEVTSQGGVVVRAPIGMSDRRIYKLLETKEEWIREHLAKMEKRADEIEGRRLLNDDEIWQLKEWAKEELPERISCYAKIIGVSYNRITIRNQKTRWGSCSGEGNLNFNCYLMRAPQEVRDYVIIHELCHRKEMNHSKRFWNEVENVMPDYRIHKKWLREHGESLYYR